MNIVVVERKKCIGCGFRKSMWAFGQSSKQICGNRRCPQFKK